MEEEETRIQGVPLARRFYALYDKKWWKILWQVWQIQIWLLRYDKWNFKAKNSHQEVEFGIYRQSFELGKELEHEEEDKCHMSY